MPQIHHTKMSERAEPTTALGMAAAMKDASKGTDVIGESVKDGDHLQFGGLKS